MGHSSSKGTPGYAPAQYPGPNAPYPPPQNWNGGYPPPHPAQQGKPPVLVNTPEEAQRLDASDGVIDGKFHGAQIYVAPVKATKKKPKDKYGYDFPTLEEVVELSDYGLPRSQQVEEEVEYEYERGLDQPPKQKRDRRDPRRHENTDRDDYGYDHDRSPSRREGGGRDFRDVDRYYDDREYGREGRNFQRGYDREYEPVYGRDYERGFGPEYERGYEREYDAVYGRHAWDPYAYRGGYVPEPGYGYAAHPYASQHIPLPPHDYSRSRF